MPTWISFRDLAANHSLLLEWLVLIASLIPALLTHREFCEKIREAKGFKKGMRCAELGFLWLLPVLIFASTKASEWSSEKVAQQTNIILENQSNRLGRAEIQLKDASNDLAAAKQAATEARAISKQQQWRSFSEERKAYAGVFLRKYAGTKITIDTLGSDSETELFGEELNKLLNANGWQSSMGAVEMITGGVPVGVYITAHRLSDISAASALDTFLNGCGIRSVSGPASQWSDSDISVFVGSRPQLSKP